METKQPAHGGDIESYREQYGREPLDFSSNTNPLGMSPLAGKAIAGAIAGADRYPDPACRALCAAIGEKENLPAEYVLCGNGAADLLYRLAWALRPKTALVTAPAFSEYEAALSLAGCGVRRHFLQQEHGFALTGAILDDIRPGLELLLLCEPNNPTGLASGRDLLHRILQKCEQTGTILLVDECFNGFLPDPEQNSVLGLVRGSPRLLVLKAFTKLYGMAGVRLGYLVGSDTGLLRRLAEHGAPWAVSSLAQAAGVAALREEGYLQESRKLVQAERARVKAALEGLGCKVYPSQANYLFFYSAAPGLHKKLAGQGILIRDCRNYQGLCEGYYRVAVRRVQENDRLLAALASLERGG